MELVPYEQKENQIYWLELWCINASLCYFACLFLLISSFHFLGVVSVLQIIWATLVSFKSDVLPKPVKQQLLTQVSQLQSWLCVLLARLQRVLMENCLTKKTHPQNPSPCLSLWSAQSSNLAQARAQAPGAGTTAGGHANCWFSQKPVVTAD